MHTIASIRANFLDFLQKFFSSGRVYSAETKEQVLVWRPKEEDTQILIRDQVVPNPQILAQTPAVVVRRQPITEMNVGGMGDNLQQYDWATQLTRKLDLMQCPLEFHCLHRHDEMAEIIAQLVFFALRYHRHRLMSQYAYREIKLGAIGERRIIKTGENISVWDVPVSLTVIYHMVFDYRSHGPGTGQDEEIDMIFVPEIVNIVDDQTARGGD
jgi:hypothetical protein